MMILKYPILYVNYTMKMKLKRKSKSLTFSPKTSIQHCSKKKKKKKRNLVKAVKVIFILRKSFIYTPCNQQKLLT